MKRIRSSVKLRLSNSVRDVRFRWEIESVVYIWGRGADWATLLLFTDAHQCWFTHGEKPLVPVPIRHATSTSALIDSLASLACLTGERSSILIM